MVKFIVKQFNLFAFLKLCVLQWIFSEKYFYHKKLSHSEIFKIGRNLRLSHRNFHDSNTQMIKFIVKHFNLFAFSQFSVLRWIFLWKIKLSHKTIPLWILKIDRNQCLSNQKSPDSNTQKVKFIVKHFNLFAYSKFFELR